MEKNLSHPGPLLSEDSEKTVFFVEPSVETSEEGTQQINGRACFAETIELQDEDGKGNDSSNRAQFYSPRHSDEQSLLQTIKEQEDFSDVKEKLTAKAIMNLRNPLLSAIKVTEKLHDRAENSAHDKGDFIDLANRVEEFTLRFLDSMKYDGPLREMFSRNPETTVILDTAIKLEQKKFFDHPIIIDLMLNRWYGDFRGAGRGWWLFLNLWCLFDVALFPFMLLTFHLLARVTRPKSFCQQIYWTYKTPYFIFVRDTLSYLALLGLHLAICLEPSQLSFSGLEWAILVFFVGRLLIENKQFKDAEESERERARKGKLKTLRSYLRSPRSESENMRVKTLKRYFRDRWNTFDLTILLNFFCAIFPLRIVTWAVSESVTNNRALVVAGYLYGFNTMLLTIRAFGHLLETIKGVGTIQIALFHIIRDVVVVVVHFVAITLAFSSTITKVCMAEKSMIGETPSGKESICNGTGILCWQKITTHLGWSLLELSEGLELFHSVDHFSEILAQLLFAIYLVVSLILLINMLIALLSNTYQRVQDNSQKEWAFEKAITIQTYSDYHPVPVPYNIGSLLVLGLYRLRKREKSKFKIKRRETFERQWLDEIVNKLLDKYRRKYGESFPPTCKLDQVLEDTENAENMINQVLYRTFMSQQGNCNQALLPTGPKAWKTHGAIRVEDCFLTCEDNMNYKPYTWKFKGYGARHCIPFSPRFPHFEVMILETGMTKWLGLGVVFEDYGTDLFPGWEKGTVGYHTSDRRIFEAGYAAGYTSKRTTGPAVTRRGDVIRCTVMFEDEQERDGKVQVPVLFTVNGRRIMPVGETDETYIDYTPDKPLYPYIAFKHPNSVLAKMCAKQDSDHHSSQLQELKSDLADVCQHLISAREDIVRQSLQIQEVKSDLADVREEILGGMDDSSNQNLQLQEKMEVLVSREVRKATRGLEEKLDAVLVRLGGRK